MSDIDINKFPTKEMEVEIEACMPNKWNPNRMTEKQFANLLASIKKNGFQRFITVRETAGMYEIMDGEHRWRACKELGFKTIKVHNLGEVSDTIAKELTLIFNTLHGDHDILAEAQVLKDLKEAEAAGQGVLFAEDDKTVQEKIDLLNFDFKQYENAELTDNQKDLFKSVMGTVLKLNSQLNAAQNVRGNDDAWQLIQQGMDWCEAMIKVFKASKEKIKVVAKNAPLEGQESIFEPEPEVD